MSEPKAAPKAETKVSAAAALAKTHARLKEIRKSETVELKPTPLLRDTIVGLDGEEVPFSLRYYQVQGVFHMLTLPRMVLGDDCGLGKTIETIATFCYLWQKEPKNRIIVVAPKSAIRQWAAEIRKFTHDIKVYITSDEEKGKGESAVDARQRVYEAWANAPEDEHSVLIMNYAILVRDWNHGGFQPPRVNGKLSKEPVLPGLMDRITNRPNLVVVFDEATAFKSTSTKTWEICGYLSHRAHRSYGLTATLLKNHLMEGFAIYRVIKPGVFTSKNKFQEDYCHILMQNVGRARIALVVGYKNLDKFRDTIDPFFLGRKKHEVAKELPKLTTREISFRLNGAEEAKYTQALNGVLELGDGEVRDYEENKALVSLGYCQQVVNSLALLQYKEGDEIDDFIALDQKTHKVGTLGSKEQALVDLLTGELDDERVIVFTRFESLVGRLQAILKQEGITSVRITGKENDQKRRAAQEAFQDLKGKTKVCFITAAGSEAINLQAAVAMVFFDAPWSWGDFVQTIGRMIRIGSPHLAVLAFHLVAERGGNREDRKTIDHHVLQLLRKKKAMIDQVLGDGAVGALKFDKSGSPIKELLKMMQGKPSPKAA